MTKETSMTISPERVSALMAATQAEVDRAHGMAPDPTSKREQYRGCVLADRERNGYDDSDFYAVVWDEARQCVTSIEIGSTRYGGGDRSWPVDATPEVKTKARVWWAKTYADLAVERAKQPKSVAVGDTVRVIAGRKVLKGE
jgi:hypothetical protein